MRPKNIWLVGYRCTGKTTVGKALARRLGMRFIDTDELIEEKAGKSIKEIFAEGGEPHFRELEHRVVVEASGVEGQVIGAGGGAVLREDNVSAMKRSGLVVLLEADAETIHRRMLDDPRSARMRPELTNKDRFEEIVHLLEHRREYYEGASDIRVSTVGVSVDEVVEQIMKHIERGCCG